MGIKQKIYLNVFLSLVLIGAMYVYVLPKISNGLVALQDSHIAQITKLKQLNEQAKSLSKMNEDLRALEQMGIKPADFFTSDATLVNEIKTIEQIAANTNSVLTISITGTADKALSIPSASGLSQVPFTISLKSSFPNVVRFVKYLENRYFIAPISGINISSDENNNGGASAIILSNFYIYKPQAQPAAVTPVAPKTTPDPLGQ